MKALIILFIFFIFSTVATRSVLAAEEKPKIAILDFKVSDAALRSQAQIIGGMIKSYLIETGLFIIIDRSNAEDIAKERALQNSGCTDSICAVKIGQMLSADLILTGTIGKFTAGNVLNITVFRVSDSSQVFGQSLKIDNDPAILTTDLHFLSNKIIEKITGRDVASRAQLSSGNEQRTAYILSLTFPGFGQIYVGRLISGLFFATLGAAAIYQFSRTSHVNNHSLDRDRENLGYYSLAALSLPGLNAASQQILIISANMNYENKSIHNKSINRYNRNFIALAWLLPILDLTFIEFSVDRESSAMRVPARDYLYEFRITHAF